jgi:hypothetical protein
VIVVSNPRLERRLDVARGVHEVQDPLSATARPGWQAGRSGFGSGEAGLSPIDACLAGVMSSTHTRLRRGEYGDLMAQDQDLGVFGAVERASKGEPAQCPEHR